MRYLSAEFRKCGVHWIVIYFIYVLPVLGRDWQITPLSTKRPDDSLIKMAVYIRELSMCCF